jgi:putative transposase
MTNHVHLLAAPAEADSLPRTMQSLGRLYVRYVNGRCGRSGTLWEGRYRAAPVDSDAYFFDCCRYIELNPVRARMVARPRYWRWSSYRAHALGAADPLVSAHPLYRALARNVRRNTVSASGHAWTKNLFPSCVSEQMAAGRCAATASSARLRGRSNAA